MITSISTFLEQRRDSIEFEIGGGVKDSDIKMAEDALSVSFRGGYRRFLLDVGWLSINNIYFFGVRGDDQKKEEGNIVAMTEFSRKTWNLPHHLIPVYSSEDVILWCIDLSSKENDPPIIAYATETNKTTGKVAVDFWTCITEYLEEEDK